VGALSVLFVGGTGKISSACAALAAGHGLDVVLLNRGTNRGRPRPTGVEVLTADVRDDRQVRDVLGGRSFDVVVNFWAFTREHAASDIETFTGRVGQYVFISLASAYAKPVPRLPIHESTPLANPYWEYSRNKIAAEGRFMAEFQTSGFPVTIVRPSQTYDRTSIPLLGGWTAIDRMRRGLPVVVHGDGTSLWVMTHNEDFARAFLPLLGNPRAVGDSFHITSDEVQTWNQIYTTLGRAAGVEPALVHITSERIAELVPAWGPGLLGDAAHSVTFDNSKIREIAAGWRATITYAQAAREIIDWFDADESRRRIDDESNARLDALIASVTD
jgi:nucleoside-diphosphate-sugar epimerase